MQERLLRSDKLVRLVSAPTGSGKSYAFMRAVLDKGSHVLFIVPTKRLLQNLIEDARGQAREQLRKREWDDAQVEAWIDEQIVEWSGNQASDGAESLAATRVRQFLNGGALSSGRVIFAIPEVVVTMISGIRITGASTVNPFLYLRHFDHIVFDEFHTIDDRSFGLACLFSLLAVAERRGKVSLLSATPIDVTKVLERLGVGAGEVEQISEETVAGHPPDHRPIHGDVTLSLRECSLSESFGLSINAVRESIAGNRTVIVIYDSLQRLKQEEPTIQGMLIRAGLQDARILPINSIDDSTRKPGEPRRGRRYADPREYDVLLCTSSVEIGVTFRSNLMFMEPGFGLASFMQRVGRVSRGADNGHVIVSLSEARRNRHAWTRTIKKVIEDHEELDVQTFTAKILREVQRRLQPNRKEAETDLTTDSPTMLFYRRAYWRGIFWAALFIVAIRQTKMTVQREANARLQEISPNVVRFVEAKIGEIMSVDVVNDNLRPSSQPHKRWVKALLSSALTYRDIGATIEVVDPDGTRHSVTESFLRRATDIPIIISEEDGEQVVQLVSRTLDQEIKAFTGKPEVQKMTWYVRSPIDRDSFTLSIRERDKGSEQLNVRLVEAWRNQFARFIPAQGRAHDDPCKKVMGAATALVECLGRAPLDEDYEDSAESAMFA
ncbi:MAG: DEAD/DEAH box helicase [Gemmatimonadota bacterium]|nr:DEAD/DEAH box helicase [Gemmatimonadota bacterium]